MASGMSAISSRKLVRLLMGRGLEVVRKHGDHVQLRNPVTKMKVDVSTGGRWSKTVPHFVLRKAARAARMTIRELRDGCR